VSLADALARFAFGSGRRNVLGQRLARVYEIAANTGHLSRFIVFGSFVSDKPDPNDVDVFMVMDDNFDMTSLTGEPRTLYADHSAAQNHFGCSVFWLRHLAAIGGEQAAIEDWQLMRDGTRRGILEITTK
jgi:hypothetical protein